MRQSKESIIKAYRDLIAQNEGKLIGARVFERESGVPKYAWSGGYWRNWAAFQADMGYTPNSPTQRTDNETVLRSFAKLALELGRLPTEPDLDLKRKSDPGFPNKSVFRRWGSRDSLLVKVSEFSKEKPGFDAVAQLLDDGISASLDQRLTSFHVQGFVYLLRSGKYYKLGRTNAAGRRLRELAIQLPGKPNTVHVIETDDPEGIEQYWHRRFEKKRQGGEWFALNQDDVRAFKKRRFQ
ncbi:MAG: GIY-YIG nuclease family protein [Acidobacteria bacterium]|nr:GIY-YIG nuclease family protein [Acidobacteriota bacterium]MCI0623775.1 GIY-YIG nuclease family protein [Acidobacteriota bacterium]